MREGPRDPRKSMIRPVLLYAGIIGFVASMGGLLVYWWGVSHFDIEKTRTLVFTLAVFFELFIIFSIRSKEPFWKSKNFFSNRWLILAVIASIGLQLLAIYSPLSKVLEAVPLGATDWLVVIGASFVGFVIIEFIKRYFVKR
jgi:Ca2+-transporting ATPase